jgi:hypothetical protein
MFWVVPLLIIRSAYKSIYSICDLSRLVESCWVYKSSAVTGPVVAQRAVEV